VPTSVRGGTSLADSESGPAWRRRQGKYPPSVKCRYQNQERHSSHQAAGDGEETTRPRECAGCVARAIRQRCPIQVPTSKSQGVQILVRATRSLCQQNIDIARHAQKTPRECIYVSTGNATHQLSSLFRTDVQSLIENSTAPGQPSLPCGRLQEGRRHSGIDISRIPRRTR
jgi:hypothetical protein